MQYEDMGSEEFASDELSDQEDENFFDKITLNGA